MKHLCMTWLKVGLLALALGVFLGCGEDPQQLFETAQFEEKQGNRTHAAQLYELIIQMNPESDVAKKAQERLAKLKK